MIYYTSDLHLGHANVIHHCNRPFETVDDMDVALIANWNKRIQAEDTVYIVGDLFFRNKLAAGDYLKKLNGNKILIVGNHDHTWMSQVNLDRAFASVVNLMTIKDGETSVVLCHYPMLSWRGSSRGSLMVHGHIHNNTNADYWPYLQSHTNILNAGVDVNNYMPVTLDELIANNAHFKEGLTDKVVEIDHIGGAGC